MRILLTIIIIIISINYSFGCTNLIVTKGASDNNSNMITYSADAGGFMEPLFYLSEADHKEGDMLKVYDWDTGKYLGEIKQALHTYRVVGNINQHQLSIGETTFTGLDSLRDTTGILDYGSLIRITLQRARTAKEAIKVIEELTSEYGYYSTGESFSIADPNEIWIMELIGKGVGNKGINFVARRIPDGYIAAHANQSRIRKVLWDDPSNCIYSEGVDEFAKEKNIYQEYDGEFSFADTYNPLDPGGVLYCEGRVWRFYDLAAPNKKLSPDYFRAVKDSEPYPLFIKPDKPISVKFLTTVLRDHFEGTEYDMTKGIAAGPYGCPYRWKSLSWKIEGDSVSKYGWERPIATQQTAFSFISQLRSEMPEEIGGVFWYGVDDAATSCYVPLYSSLKEVPASLENGSIAKFSWDDAFWVFNAVANRSYIQYSLISKDIIEVQQSFENKFFAMQESVEEAALNLYKSEPKLAQEFISDYSVNQYEKVTQRWRNLWEEITVKYNDGYMNDVNKNNGRSPSSVGYENEFLKEVIKSKPGYYDVKWKKK